MIIEYEVECFDRCLVLKCPNSYAEHIGKIKHILNKAYYDWHNPENIEDLEEREWVEDNACCEEYMMDKVSDVYPELNEGSWNSFYYGDDEDEIAEDMDNHQYDRKYNISQLNNAIDHLEDRKDRFEPFEKLGNEAYWIVEDCIKKLKELKEQYAEEEI